MQKSGTNRQLLSVGSMPLWVATGSQDEQMNSSNLNQIDWTGDAKKMSVFSKSDHIIHGTQDDDKQTCFQLSFSIGENKNFLKENNFLGSKTNDFQQLSPPQKSYFELGLGQPTVYGNYPLVEQCHGLFTNYGNQPTGRVMLPFSVTTENGPIYVNPKQYHGILRRRKMRAKGGLKSRSTRDKPYIHESRHRHACRRVRGAGGRFLNTKKLENDKEKQQESKAASDQLNFVSSHSSSSEVLQSEGGNFKSSSKEVTSVYYNKELDYFGINPSRTFSFHHLSNMEANRNANNWVTSDDACCNFF